MGDYAVVAIGYNRPDSMKRLLDNLESVEYGNDDVTLIVSIDNSGSNEVERIAADFKWSHGDKLIKTYPERQGLKKHILHCGSFVSDYRAIAVFEDDVVPSIAFYQYMKEAVQFYEADDNIAGISLYNHLWNVNTNLPFQPAYTGYDTYFLQFAQSWGQVWMKNQWQEFEKWYELNSAEFDKNELLPDFVNNWGNKSWLKYHVRYCVENHKYFVYPYQAFSTCYSDVGEHCTEKDTKLQIPMVDAVVPKQWTFPNMGDSKAAYYDVYFERVVDNIKAENVEYKNVLFDLYGSRTNYYEFRYLVSLKDLPYKIVCTYGLEQRPHEINVINSCPGNEIKLYDLNEKAETTKNYDDVSVFKYRFRLFRQRKMTAKCFLRDVKNHIKGIY